MDFISMRESRVSGILSLKTPQEPDVVFHGCKPSTRDTEVEGGKAPAQPRLGYIARHYLKENNNSNKNNSSNNNDDIGKARR